MSERIPWPDKAVGWVDIAKGIGETVVHVVFDQFRHEGISEHGIVAEPEPPYDEAA